MYPNLYIHTYLFIEYYNIVEYNYCTIGSLKYQKGKTMAGNKPSAFMRVFGDAPYIKVLDFLLAEGRILEYTLTDIAKYTNVAWATLSEMWPSFVSLGLVVKTREVGRAKLYKLDEENPLVQILIKCDFLLSKSFMDIKRGRKNPDGLEIAREFKKMDKVLA